MFDFVHHSTSFAGEIDVKQVNFPVLGNQLTLVVDDQMSVIPFNVLAGIVFVKVTNLLFQSEISWSVVSVEGLVFIRFFRHTLLKSS